MMTSSREEGFITKVYRKVDFSPNLPPKTKMCDIVISSLELTDPQKTLATEANNAFKLDNYNDSCNAFKGIFNGDVIKVAQVFKEDFRKIVRKTIRAIIEKPPPPSQCKSAFGVDGGTYDEKNFTTDDPMYCYICFKNLNTADNIPANRRECEHIFPITESQLVWGTYLNSFFVNSSSDDDLKHLAKLKRLYAPVCNHCNISPHKSNIRVLAYNTEDNKFEINPKLIEALLEPLDHGCRNYGNTNFITAGINDGNHEAYLEAVFQPLVNAVNKDIKFHLRKTDDKIEHDDAGKIWDLFLCRYLFYFDNKALRDIKILLVGGEDAVAVQKKLDDSNEFIKNVMARITNIIENTRTVLQVRFSPTLTKSEKNLKETASWPKGVVGVVGAVAAVVARRFATAKKALKKRLVDLRNMHNIKYRKNLELWNYFKSECKRHFKNGEVSARNYQSIYNYIISNKDDSINYLTHFNFTNADIDKLNLIAEKLTEMKAAVYAGGGKKPKFIQSGGTITQEDANEVFWHGLIEYDEPDMNSVSFLLPKFLKISDFLNAPFTNKEKEEELLNDLCISFDCEEVKEEEIENIKNGGADMNKLQQLFNSLGGTIKTDLKGILDDNKIFYTNLLEDIYNNMNSEFDGLENNRSEVVGVDKLTEHDINDAINEINSQPPTQRKEPHLFKSFKTSRKSQPNDGSSDSGGELPGETKRR